MHHKNGKEIDMAVRLIVQMEAKPGKIDELVERFNVRIAEVVKEKGCQQYELYLSTERPNQLVLLERWVNEESLEDHLELNRQRGSNVSDLRSGDTKLERYTIDD